MKLLFSCLALLCMNIPAFGQNSGTWYDETHQVEVLYRHTKLVNDWFVHDYCVKFVSFCIEDGGIMIKADSSVECGYDSILLYTPVKYYNNAVSPSLSDTFEALKYSEALYAIGEPKLYKSDINHDVLRFAHFRDSLPVIYRIVKKGDIITLTKIVTDGHFILPGRVLTRDSVHLNEKEYQKVVRLMEKGKYRGLDTEVWIYPRDILIESYIDKQYYFINMNEAEIRYEGGKKLLKIFKVLEKMSDG